MFTRFLSRLHHLLRFVAFADFFKRMFDINDTTVSPQHFVSVFTALAIVSSAITQSMYCLIREIDMPGGVVELYLGLFSMAVLGHAYTSYTEMKQGLSGKSGGDDAGSKPY